MKKMSSLTEAAAQTLVFNMKWWSRLCCLVLVVSSSRGQKVTVSPAAEDRNTETEGVNMTTSQPSLHLTTYENSSLPSLSPSSLSPISPSEGTMSTDGDANVTAETPHSATQARTLRPPVAMETTSESSSPGGRDSQSWAYILLALIILVIVVLCVILYFLRKASKTYSFELQRPNPNSDLNQPAGTFEPVYLDDLERPNLKDVTSGEEASPPPVANGTSLPPQEEDGGGGGEDVVHPPVLTNGVETSPGGDASPGDDPVDTATDPLSSMDLLLDPVGQQNENNNNPLSSPYPFVEINLDETPWSDQFLTCPEASSSSSSSSVLPFSPFSF